MAADFLALGGKHALVCAGADALAGDVGGPRPLCALAMDRSRGAAAAAGGVCGGLHCGSSGVGRTWAPDASHVAAMTRRRRGRSAKEKASTSAALVAHPEHAQAALTSDVDRGQGRAPAPQVTGASGGIGLVTATEFLCTWPACVPVGADLQSPRLPRCAVRRRVMRHGMIRPRRQSVAALQWQRTRSLRQHVPPTLANAGARLVDAARSRCRPRPPTRSLCSIPAKQWPCKPTWRTRRAFSAPSPMP